MLTGPFTYDDPVCEQHPMWYQSTRTWYQVLVMCLLGACYVLVMCSLCARYVLVMCLLCVCYVLAIF